jgi:hypothetical protein
MTSKWEMYLGSTTTTLTEEYLSEKYPMVRVRGFFAVVGW